MPKIDLRELINDDVLEVVAMDGTTYRIADVPMEFIVAMTGTKEIQFTDFARFIVIALKDQGMTEEKARGLGFLEANGLFRALTARFFAARTVLDRDPTLAQTARYATPPDAPTKLVDAGPPAVATGGGTDSIGDGQSRDSSARIPDTSLQPPSV